MPVTRTCTFCGTDIEPGTGKMFIRKDGTVYFFCSSKCQKNLLNLGRIGRKVRWTRRYVKALSMRAPRRRAVPEPVAEEVAEPPAGEDKESVLEEFAQIPGIGKLTAEGLWEAGYTSLDKIRAADEEALLQVKGIGPATAKKVLEYLKEGG